MAAEFLSIADEGIVFSFSQASQTIADEEIVFSFSQALQSCSGCRMRMGK
ncbi:hypothetical protein ACP6PL_05930 [Dapis sp. BLCC M126]